MTLAALLVLLSLLNAATGKNLAWWQKATVYQIYPRSFRDSDGDGVGDLRGITEKLPYLRELGVDALWLSPIFQSPMADFGYDVSVFTDVDRLYGTLDDFDELLRAAHHQGLRLVLDFVPNHTSDQHPWFQSSSDPHSCDFASYRDFYVWRPGREFGGRPQPPNNWVSAFGGSAWECATTRRAGLCYLHQYSVHQPDLNYSNPDVLATITNVLRFWLDRGVDGVRVDAVRALQEDPLFRDNSVRSDGSLGTERTKNLPASYDLVYHFRTILDQYPHRVMISEAYGSLEQVVTYCGDGRRSGAHVAFNFFLCTRLDRTSTAPDFKDVIDSWMVAAGAKGCWPNWLLGNHDLRRVSSRFDPSLVDALNMLVAVLPGTSFTYYGEEIGMADNAAISYERGADPKGLQAGPSRFHKVSRDFQRTPFQWDNSTSAGFSRSKSTWLPVNSDYVSVNVATQETNFRSHLNVYRRLQSLRRVEDQVLQLGELQTEALSRYVLLISRRHESGVVMALINLGPGPEHVDLRDHDVVPEKITVRVATGNALLREGSSRSRHSLTLAPFSGIVVSPYDKWSATLPRNEGRIHGLCKAATLLSLLSSYLTCHH